MLEQPARTVSSTPASSNFPCHHLFQHVSGVSRFGVLHLVAKISNLAHSKFQFARFTLPYPPKHERFPPSPSHTLALPHSLPGLARSSPGLRPFLARPSPGLARPSPGPCLALAHPRFKQSSRQNGQKRNLLLAQRKKIH